MRELLTGLCDNIRVDALCTVIAGISVRIDRSKCQATGYWQFGDFDRKSQGKAAEGQDGKERELHLELVSSG